MIFLLLACVPTVDPPERPDDSPVTGDDSAVASDDTAPQTFCESFGPAAFVFCEDLEEGPPYGLEEVEVGASLQFATDYASSGKKGVRAWLPSGKNQEGGSGLMGDFGEPAQSRYTVSYRMRMPKNGAPLASEIGVSAIQLAKEDARGITAVYVSRVSVSLMLLTTLDDGQNWTSVRLDTRAADWNYGDWVEGDITLDLNAEKPTASAHLGDVEVAAQLDGSIPGADELTGGVLLYSASTTGDETYADFDEILGTAE